MPIIAKICSKLPKITAAKNNYASNYRTQAGICSLRREINTSVIIENVWKTI